MGPVVDTLGWLQRQPLPVALQQRSYVDCPACFLCLGCPASSNMHPKDPSGMSGPAPLIVASKLGLGSRNGAEPFLAGYFQESKATVLHDGPLCWGDSFLPWGPLHWH